MQDLAHSDWPVQPGDTSGMHIARFGFRVCSQRGQACIGGSFAILSGEADPARNDHSLKRHSFKCQLIDAAHIIGICRFLVRRTSCFCSLTILASQFGRTAVVPDVALHMNDQP